MRASLLLLHLSAASACTNDCKEGRDACRSAHRALSIESRGTCAVLFNTRDRVLSDFRLPCIRLLLNPQLHAERGTSL